MKIAILGTRGIPNIYGGFEQFAEILSAGLVEKGHEVTVFNPHYHPYAYKSFNNVKIVKKYCPERFFGAAAHILYDILCLKHAKKSGFDIILECGYGSAAFSYMMCRCKNQRIITNMDGMEWKRSKWSFFTRKILKWAEKTTVKKSTAIIADHLEIQKYYREKYGISPVYIPYGAAAIEKPSVRYLRQFGLEENRYFLVISRIEPENNIHTILKGFTAARNDYKIAIISEIKSSYARALKKAYFDYPNVVFLGPNYNRAELESLRFYSKACFHGHSIGGTNPSLLEAMAAGAFIIAHDNPFNKGVLDNNALFFLNYVDIQKIIENIGHHINQCKENFSENNYQKIKELYSKEMITRQYEKLFLDIKHPAKS